MKTDLPHHRRLDVPTMGDRGTPLGRMMRALNDGSDGDAALAAAVNRAQIAVRLAKMLATEEFDGATSPSVVASLADLIARETRAEEANAATIDKRACECRMFE
jgi:Flp pilus assembly CpaF family ATPase